MDKRTRKRMGSIFGDDRQKYDTEQNAFFEMVEALRRNKKKKITFNTDAGDCPAGTFIDADDCTECEFATWQDQTRQDDCNPCDPKTNTSRRGAVSEDECSRSSSVVVTTTQLLKSQKITVDQMAQELNYEYCFDFNRRVTHVICASDSGSRLCKYLTKKVVKGLAYGLTFVSFLWIEDSKRQGQLLPTDEYELTDCESYESDQAFKRARSAKQKLFAGFEFHILGMDSNDEESRDIEEIIQIQGGRVCGLSDLGHSSLKPLIIAKVKYDAEENSHLCNPNELDIVKTYYVEFGIPTCDSMYIIECLASTELRPLAYYIYIEQKWIRERALKSHATKANAEHSDHGEEENTAEFDETGQTAGVGADLHASENQVTKSVEHSENGEKDHNGLELEDGQTDGACADCHASENQVTKSVEHSENGEKDRDGLELEDGQTDGAGADCHASENQVTKSVEHSENGEKDHNGLELEDGQKDGACADCHASENQVTKSVEHSENGEKDHNGLELEDGQTDGAGADCHVTVAVPKMKAKYTDKQLWCLYCMKPFKQKIIRHIERKHKNEEEVIQLKQLSPKSQERINLMEKLKNKGNFRHNLDVLQKGQGEITVGRRPRKETQAENYLPCPYCLKSVTKAELTNHANNCQLIDIKASEPKNKERYKKTPYRKYVLEGKTLIDAASISGRSRELADIIENMHADQIRRAVKSDSLIGHIGELLLKNPNLRKKNISEKLRLLGRILLALGEGSDMTSLESFIHPTQFDHLVKTTESMAKLYSSEAAPSIVTKVGQIMLKAARVLQGIALRNGVTEDSTNQFIQLMELEWRMRINAMARAKGNQKKRNKVEILPLTEDLVIFQQHLIERIEDLRQQLQSNCKEDVWLQLSRATLARLILFNKRRAGEAESALLKEYTDRPNWDENTLKEVKDTLTLTEMQLAKRLDMFYTRGKFGQDVPLLLPPEAHRAIKVLLVTREKVGVAETNPHLFPRLYTDSPTAQDGSFCVREAVKQCGLEDTILQKPEYINSTNVRKYAATVSQLLDMAPNELTWLAKHMGHTKDVHLRYYRLQHNTIELTKVSKLLYALDKGLVNKFKGKSLASIDIADLPEVCLEDKREKLLSAESSVGDDQTQSSVGDDQNQSSVGDNQNQSSIGDNQSSVGDNQNQSSVGDNQNQSSIGDNQSSVTVGVNLLEVITEGNSAETLDKYFSESEVPCNNDACVLDSHDPLPRRTRSCRESSSLVASPLIDGDSEDILYSESSSDEYVPPKTGGDTDSENEPTPTARRVRSRRKVSWSATELMKTKRFFRIELQELKCPVQETCEQAVRQLGLVGKTWNNVKNKMWGIVQKKRKFASSLFPDQVGRKAPKWQDKKKIANIPDCDC